MPGTLSPSKGDKMHEAPALGVNSLMEENGQQASKLDNSRLL